MNTFTTENLSLLALVAALMPLISFCGIFLFPGNRARGAYFSIFNICVSLVISILVFTSVWNEPQVHVQWNWFTIGSWKFTAGILLNNLSVLMMLLVSFIATLVHVYSTRYMQGDAYYFRYWAYLGLFCFSMLGLVIADSLLLIYMFWELVGFSSYLLIGFWFTKESAVLANKKAFLMNRLGDLGFLSGLMILFTQFNTLDLDQLFGVQGLMAESSIRNGLWISGSHQMPAIWLTFAGIAFFLGAVAKSAQFPLHTWLPDAMEGPTSVSSLIHAATMVAAGVFLLGRIYPLFDEQVLLIIAITGAFTAFMAATIALVQNDIKRILAFSTISQLGFMMLAMGVEAFASSIFHLVTHAFFKCLLFLAAGAVIHEMHHLKEKKGLDFDHQDIRNMGGLRKYMPLTFITMLLAALALVGIPLTAGYLSKDAILVQAFEWAEMHNGLARLIPYSALLTSWLTAFYIARLIFKVFFGELRVPGLIKGSEPHLHEAPPAMAYVLVVLGIFCLFPAYSTNPLHYEHSWIVAGFPFLSATARVNIFHTLIPASVNLVAIALIYFAYTRYGRRQSQPRHLSTVFFRFAEKQWYFDNLYRISFVNGTLGLSRLMYWFDRVCLDGIVNIFGKAGLAFAGISAWADRNIIDSLVNGAGSLSKAIGRFPRKMQTGRLQNYLLLAFLVIITFFILKYIRQAI